MNKQSNLDSFFGLSRDKKENPEYRSKSPDPSSTYSNKSQNNNTKKEPSRFISMNYSNPVDQSFKAGNVNLKECKTYALPHHIPRIWKIVQPGLLDIKNGKINDIFKLLELMTEFI
mmetsp:Transcript_27031/g.23936  ORF Transcript_27031/g.23936 Transcript_27031/m.23936 type:complete len:116 (+) Transcript_27031:308-655(+)